MYGKFIINLFLSIIIAFGFESSQVSFSESSSPETGRNEIWHQTNNGVEIIEPAGTTNEERIVSPADLAGPPVLSKLSGPYLGQTPPDTIPKRFPPSSLLSDGIWWWHGSPVFSPDGKEMFFVKYISNKPRGNMEMYWMKMGEDGEWTSPVHPSFASDSGDNSPVYADEGNRLLFTSYRDGSIKIYQVTRADTGWSAPELVNMDYPSLPGNLGWDISLTPDQTMYFELYVPGYWMDIYKSKLEEGEYSQFEKLPDQINSSSNDATPYIAADESYIIFMSNRSGGYGYHDLYVSFRNADSTWTLAVNMGNQINGSSEDAMPLLSPDGEYLFFNSQKSGDLGYNAYWVKSSVIQKFHPSGVVEHETVSLPEDFRLHQNFPNPFNPTTTIEFDIYKTSLVRLEVYNVLGRLVKSLVNEMKNPGEYSITWEGRDDAGHSVSSGLYFYRLTCGKFSQVHRALLLK
jgi:Tol biopolymer transport system component